ncbi:hypothetical protein GTR02_00350 [Kineococcus sp. R8]|uniref:hypothetical protein n=1 Tax=Kineococcus siccus TaxID=2696567 RepID=UPI0014136086|nr:hypothetical protein [Kineococcus siccus]NAZ80271.1 hypothetical protein [Kineococcus siccus]
MTEWIDDPILTEAFGGDQDLVYDSLDDRESLERQIAQPAHDPATTLTRWRKAIATARSDEEVGDQANTLGINRRDPIEGTSWRRWGQWLEQRLTEVIEHPETRLNPDDLPDRYTWQSHRGTPLSSSAAARFTEAATSAHRSSLDAWVTSPVDQGLRRHLLHDTGEIVGRVNELSAAEWSDDQVVVSSHETTTVGLRMLRSPGGGWSVAGIHPALPETTAVARFRAQWPALTSALGGYFSDDPRLFPWRDQRDLLFGEAVPFLTRVDAEGADLLALPDEQLRTAVRALGCAVEPPHLRLWLTWMFWRIRTFDWSEEPGSSPAGP